ncbi:MAG: PspA/IM30 family protein [Chloroflexi bacterium]|nr:PspA/IM30 family protein [Chloroflexota bacterium]
MSSFLNQFSKLMKSGVETLLAPAADPRETFTSPQQRRERMLDRVREALTQNAALLKRLVSRLNQAKEKLPRLEEQARIALHEKREDFARLALQHRQLTVIEIRSIESQIHEVQQEAQRIAIIEQKVVAQIESFRTRQEMIAARYNTAEAQVMAHEAVGGVTDELSDLGAALEIAEEKAENMQARASALDQLTEVGVLSDQMFAQHEIDRAVEEQLQKMRAQGSLI